MDERVTPPTRDSRAEPMSRAAPPGRGRRTARIVLALLIVAAAAYGFYQWPHRAAPAPDAAAGKPGRTGQTPPQLVGSAVVDKGDVRVVLNELGTVIPLAVVTVKTQIAGQYVEIGFKEGQTVHKGDFLAQIDPRPYEVALQQAQGTLARDKGLLEQARADLVRYQTLAKQDSISRQQADNQRFVVEQYQGTVLADEALVNSAKLNLTYCHIVAPIDGQVGLRLVDPGNYVQTSDANGVAVLTQMQPISVLFSVPEDSLRDIIPRLRAGATMTVAAYDRANTKHLASGQLTTLDNQIDTTTGTLKLRAVFDNADLALYPNQFVNARLLVNTLKDAVRIPVAAVQRGEPGTFVYLVGADDTVSVRVIKLGPTDEGFVAVTSGLQVGDRVVTDGTDRLREGAKVIVQTAQTGGPAAGGGDGRRKGQGGGPGGQTDQPPGGPRPDGAPSERRRPANTAAPAQ